MFYTYNLAWLLMTIALFYDVNGFRYAGVIFAVSLLRVMQREWFDVRLRNKQVVRCIFLRV
jgi:hypothetical protein